MAGAVDKSSRHRLAAAIDKTSRCGYPIRAVLGCQPRRHATRWSLTGQLTGGRSKNTSQGLDPCTVVAGGSRVRSCFVSLISDVTFGECRGDEAETSTARAGQALGPHVSWWWECVGRCWGSALIRIRRCGSILLSELVLEKRP